MILEVAPSMAAVAMLFMSLSEKVLEVGKYLKSGIFSDSEMLISSLGSRFVKLNLPKCQSRRVGPCFK